MQYMIIALIIDFTIIITVYLLYKNYFSKHSNSELWSVVLLAITVIAILIVATLPTYICSSKSYDIISEVELMTKNKLTDDNIKSNIIELLDSTLENKDKDLLVSVNSHNISTGSVKTISIKYKMEVFSNVYITKNYSFKIKVDDKVETN